MELTYTLQAAVCEDRPSDTKRLVRHIEKSGIRAEVSCFASGEEFLSAFRSEKYDIVFMDIYMSGATGIEVAEKIRRIDKHVTLVFTTTSLEHTLVSYSLKAISYLIKPVQAEDIKEVLELTVAKRKTRAAITVTLSGGKEADIPLDNILYFEHQDHVVVIHTSASGILRTSQSARLDEMEKRLPMPPFLRCHRSVIVNLNHVCGIDRDNHFFNMMNGDQAHITMNKKLMKEYVETFQRWMTEKTRRDEV